MYNQNMKIHPKVTIGHIHLTVSNLDTAISFYRDVLGFEIVSRYGSSAIFLSAGGYHHHIGLNTWAGVGAKPAPHGHTGLYHFALLYPDRKELAKALKNIIEKDYPITGTANHGVSEAIYLNDPDGNGIELYVDRPKESWKIKENGEIDMVTELLDIDSLLGEIK